MNEIALKKLNVIINTNNKGIIKLIPKHIHFISIYECIVFLTKYSSSLQNKFENIKEKVKKKKIDIYDDEKIIISIGDYSIKIFWKDININKNKGIFLLELSIRELDINILMNEIINCIKKDSIAKILRLIINATDSDSKYELLSTIIIWICKNNIQNEILYDIADNEFKMKLMKYEVKVEDINLI